MLRSPFSNKTYFTSCWECGQVSPQVSAFLVDGLGWRKAFLPKSCLLSGAAHSQWLMDVAGQFGTTLNVHPSSSAPVELADTFAGITALFIASLCPTPSHLCLPKLIVRSLLIKAPMLISVLQRLLPGTQLGTLTTRDLHKLGPAYLSSLPHFTAPLLTAGYNTFFCSLSCTTP